MGQNNIKVLLVEDSKPAALLIMGMLEVHDYHLTEWVTSGKKALESIKTETPDIILMDIVLEGTLDGIETVKMIPQSENIPVIFITSTSDEKFLERSIETEAYGFLIKPFKDYELHSAISTTLSKYSRDRLITESERKYKSLFENMTDAFILAEIIKLATGGTDFIIREANLSFIMLVDKSYNDIINRTIKEVFPDIKKHLPDWKDILLTIERKKTSKKLKINLETPPITLAVTAYSPDENFIAFIIDDITETVNAEKKLLLAHDEMRNLLLSIDSILIGVTNRDTITHWNNNAEKILDITADEAFGKKIVELPIGWQWPLIYEGISNSISENRSIQLKDIKLIKNNQEIRYLGITINPITTNEGVLQGFLLYGRDVTEKRHMEMQLLQDQKLKSIGELAAGIAHEINTPTQYVNDNTYFLKESFEQLIELLDLYRNIIKDNQNNEDINPYIQSIKKLEEKIDINFLLEEIPAALKQNLEGLEHIAGIVKSMRSLSRPDNESTVLFDINKAIQDTVNISRNEWKYNSELQLNLDNDLFEIEGYPAEINQVLLNIIINSAHAIEEAIDNGIIGRGNINIKTQNLKKHIQIKIEDNGIGIPDNVIDKIYDPFFTTKDIDKGTGQGLAISYNIIKKKHKGKIIVESTEKKGTKFIIELPCNL